MSDPSKTPLSKKDSSDSGDEANVPKDQGARSRVCPVIEETLVTEASDSFPAELEGAVGGEDASTSLSGASRPTCLSPNWSPDDAGADSGKISPKKSPVAKIYDTIKGQVKVFFEKFSPTKESPNEKIPKKEKSPKEKSPKEKSPKEKKTKKTKKDKKDKSPSKPDKPPKPKKTGGFESETRDIKSLPPSSRGFQPYLKLHYDVKSVKSVEETDYTDMGGPMSPCEVTSIPPDSLPTSPRSKDSDDEGTPRKQRRFDFKKDSDKDDDDDDKDKAA